MSQLVTELKNEHAAIVQVLTRVKELGIGNDEAKKLLFSAKAHLLAHLKKENERLYPRLRQAAETNPELKGTLDIFAKDMEGIAATAMRFFDTYTQSAAGLDFARDFGQLVAALSARIRKEESIVYREYDRLQGA